ncbi:metal-dependent hydrolase [Halobaculum magnesiiphilum]|uniref:Metal-dependent hydrolase n=1 Tax=Halobaculum magnesiiphilum TaxID=1017351 RepID=A0A8T8WFT5_9EURY|nr:metal-dependent hydrolase [Halobaculum magnesiiphilum]QZP38691.1 metal-dependent hydrolase [Halobaculum magnesiiphilum]
MYKRGHLGVAMLTLAPITFWLLVGGYPAFAVLVAGTVLYLAMLPDMDHRVPGISHRGPTHSLLFAGVVGAVFAGAASLVEPVFSIAVPAGLSMVAFGFLLGFGSVVAHLLGDVITPAGVNFLWPYPKEWSLYLTNADSTLWNWGLFALGVCAMAGAVALAVRGVPV